MKKLVKKMEKMNEKIEHKASEERDSLQVE